MWLVSTVLHIPELESNIRRWLMYYIMRKQGCLQGNLCIEED